MYKVIIADDRGGSTVFVLNTDEILVGRGADSVIRLNDLAVAPRQARLIRGENGYFVENLSSDGGTKVNGVPVASVTPIKHGDEIVIGRHRLAVVVEPTQPVATTWITARSQARVVRPVFLAAAGVAAIALATYLTTGDEPRLTIPPVWRAAAVPPGGFESTEAFVQQAAETEQHNAAAFQAIQRAFDRREYAAVLDAVATIGERSAYRSRANELARDSRRRLVTQRLATAARQRGKGRCREARKEAEAVLALDPRNETARQLIARCTRPGAIAAALSSRSVSGRAMPPPPPEPDITPRFETARPRRPIDERNPYAADIP